METFEEGEPISHFITDEKPDPIKKNLAKIGVDVLLKMVRSFVCFCLVGESEKISGRF